MMRDRIVDIAVLTYGALRAVLASISWDNLTLPHNEEIGELVLVALICIFWSVLILHTVYELTLGWFV